MSCSPGFSLKLHQLPHIPLVGMKIRTAKKRYHLECPQLWEEFAPRMSSLYPFIEDRPVELWGVTYGLAFLEQPDSGVLDYWAAVPGNPMGPLPGDYSLTYVPEGTYAACRVPSLGSLAKVYQELTQCVSLQLPDCFLPSPLRVVEIYDSWFQMTGELEIFIPVRTKTRVASVAS